MKAYIYISGLLILATFASCTDKTEYYGDSMTNYPDLNLIAKDYLLKYKNEPFTYLKINIEKGKKDSSYVHSEDIDWKQLENLFSEANLYQKKLDMQYKITVISDTTNPQMTLLYTGLNPKNKIQKLSINAETFDNKIKSVYWELHDEGFFSSEEKKILYVVGKTIQIQNNSKKAFSSAKREIIQYVFLN